jgi:signal transduction histidine kinase/CheY-like chemotaxis protein
MAFQFGISQHILPDWRLKLPAFTALGAGLFFLLAHALSTSAAGGIFLSVAVVSFIAAVSILHCLCNRLGKRIKGLEAEIGAIDTARSNADAANSAKSRFLATISHEIRTPMTGVIGMNSLLLETELTSEQQSYAMAIDASSRALLSLVDEILDTSKIEAGTIELDTRPFSIVDVIEGVTELLAPRAHAKNIEVATYVSSAIPPTVLGDANRLRQVLLNLAGNAIKFTEFGGVTISAEPDLPVRPDWCGVRFEIADTGIGISPAQHQRIFEMFAQERSDIRKRYGGTGLGLAISRDLVRRMGGEIECDSQPGVGATFAFVLRFGSSENANLLSPVPLAGRRIALAVPRGPTSAALRRTLLDIGAEVQELDIEENAAALIRSIFQVSPLHDMIVDSALEPKLQHWLADSSSDGPSSTRLWLLLQPEERRRYRCYSDLGLGYLLKPLRRSTLLRQFVERDMQRLTRTVEQLKRPFGAKDALRQPLTVWLVEDNPINARLTMAMLQKAGHMVTHLVKGEDAVAAMRECVVGTSRSRPAPDLILMDVQLPGMTGVEATQHIRFEEITHGAAPHPIIALTANARAEDRDLCIASGMNGFLTKPFDRADLDEAIARVALRTAA